MSGIRQRVRPDLRGVVPDMPPQDVSRATTSVTIVSMQYDTPDKWGGEIKLNNGGIHFIEPNPACLICCAQNVLTRRNELKAKPSWQ